MNSPEPIALSKVTDAQLTHLQTYIESRWCFRHSIHDCKTAEHLEVILALVQNEINKRKEKHAR